MFKIKICGVTNREDVIVALEAGADAIGLNFYEKSRRSVNVSTARAITDALYEAAPIGRSLRPSGLIYPVGVFVNHSVAEVQRIYDAARLAVAQLHGDELPEVIAALTNIPAIRVARLGERGVSAIADDLIACRTASRIGASQVVCPCAVLVDAAAPGQYGGTGETVSWAALADHQRWMGATPLVLAGGLTPDNVAEAIRIVRPHAVDVASGVESSPGKKDAKKVRDFIAAARTAFAAL